MKPQRIQLSRKAGWCMPENTVKVSRPGPFGNPFVVVPHYKPGRNVNRYHAVPTAEDAVECFREMLGHPGEFADAIRAIIPSLRGKNLACWCPLVDKYGRKVPCHADVLLELANAPVCEQVAP